VLETVHNYTVKDAPPPRHSVSCEHQGKTHKGTYWVAGKILTVATGGGGKSRQVGTTEPQELATQLLLELVKAGKA
jgi:hypothetical protein